MSPLFDALPAVNAKLTKIASGGASEDYDYAGGPGVLVWEGREDGYVVEEVVAEVNGQAFNEAKRTRLIVPVRVGRQATLGDTVTFDYAGETGITRRVRTVVLHEVSGEVSLTLEEG